MAFPWEVHERLARPRRSRREAVGVWLRLDGSRLEKEALLTGGAVVHEDADVRVCRPLRLDGYARKPEDHRPKGDQRPLEGAVRHVVEAAGAEVGEGQRRGGGKGHGRRRRERRRRREVNPAHVEELQDPI